MNIPEPKCIMGNYLPFCSCNTESKRKTDCYFYHDEYHMGGHIPTCNYYQKLGSCPCEDCERYIKSSDVYKGVKEYVNRDKAVTP